MVYKKCVQSFYGDKYRDLNGRRFLPKIKWIFFSDRESKAVESHFYFIKIDQVDQKIWFCKVCPDLFISPVTLIFFS